MPKLTTFQITLLSVFGALAVSGVIIFSFVASGTVSKSIGPVKIWGTLDQETFQRVLEETVKKDPRFERVSYEQKNERTYDEDLTNAIVDGTAPDLFIVRQDQVVRNRSKAYPFPFTQISSSQFSNTYIGGADPFLIPGFGVVGVPILADPLVLYWNRDILLSAGYTMPPQHWDQLADMVQKVTKKDSTGTILKATIALGEFQNVEHAKDILSTMIQQAGGRITAYDASDRLMPALMSGTSGSSASESALRFYTEFSDPSKADYTWNRSLPSSRDAFVAGDVALYIGYASEAPSLTRANPNSAITIAPLPQIRRTSTDPFPDIGAAWVYALVPVKKGNVQQAMLVASLLSSAESSSVLARSFGLVSPRRDVLQESLATASQTILHDIAPSTEEIFAKSAMISRGWTDPDPQKTNMIFRGMIEHMVSKTGRSADAVSQADRALGAILGVGG